jgi:hypothetical protein
VRLPGRLVRIFRREENTDMNTCHSERSEESRS